MARFSDVNTSSFFRVKDPSVPLDFCTQPNVTGTELSHLSNCSDAHFNNGMYRECQSSDRIIYEPFEFDTTIATDFHLVCDQQYKVVVSVYNYQPFGNCQVNFLQVALSGTLYFVGLLIGALIAGYPADKIGRKPVLFFFIAIGGFSTLVGDLVSSFGSYSFFRLLAGIGEQGLTQITCTMSIEIVGARYQSLVGNWNQIFFALGTGVVLIKHFSEYLNFYIFSSRRVYVRT